MKYFFCYVINFIRIFIILFVFLLLNKYDTGLLADGYRVNENSQVVALFLLFILTMLNVISLFMMKKYKRFNVLCLILSIVYMIYWYIV